jgi:hypothetical protein
LQDPISTEKKLGVVAHTCHPSDDGKIAVQASLGKKPDPISKITRAKRAGGVVQMVDEALGTATPQHHQKKKRGTVENNSFRLVYRASVCL